MSVQFILGRSGTGKTSYCINAIVNALLDRNDTRSLILLVPEQATYQAERAILTSGKIAGYSRLHILSFERLVFLLLGKKQAGPSLTSIGRQMIIQKILMGKSNELQVFRSCTSRPGMAYQMAQTIIELHRYAKKPEDIDELVKQLEKGESSQATALKFIDVGLILKEYLKSVKDRFIDPDIQLNLAADVVCRSELIKGSRLWVDGFAGFTEAELLILAELIKTASQTQIALCMEPSRVDLARPDASKMDAFGLFNPTEKTYAQLVEIINKCKSELKKPALLNKPRRFGQHSALAHIEKNLFNPRAPKIKADGNLHIVSAHNARSEVRFVAGKILELVKQKGFRYRDIAVIASDLESYQHYITAYFGDYSIPFFIDRRKSLNQHPVIQLIISALKVITGGFAHSDIFTLLKTDLIPIESEQIDILENYCIAFGITGDDWLSDEQWSFAGSNDKRFDQQEIDKIRRQICSPLLELKERLKPADSTDKVIEAAEFTSSVFAFLESLKVRQTIDGWIEQARQEKDYEAVEEHQQFFSKFVDVFDELCEVFDGEKMRCEDLAGILESALGRLTLALIPPTLDQILVGSIERSRHPDLKAVFIIGATQKQFPSPINYNGLLNDNDRIIAEEKNFRLAESTRHLLNQRHYLAYIAFTRPSQLLYTTYPLLDEKGSAVVRSGYLTDIQFLFEGLNEEKAAEFEITINNVNNEYDLTNLLCSRLGKDSIHACLEDTAQMGKLLEEICCDKELCELGKQVLSAINYTNIAQLEPDIVRGFFDKEITSSPTKLGTFASCPFRYFSRYILELEERQEFKFSPLDLGDFYHKMLDRFTKQLKLENKDWAKTADEQLIKCLREQIAWLIAEEPFISSFSRHSPHNAFIISSAGEILEEFVLAVSQMLRAGNFRPVMSEATFGQADTELGEYRIKLSDNMGLLLKGKIDRIDVAQTDGGKIAIVFDYKRRAKSFSVSEFYHGIDMQLPIYMLAVSQCGAEKYNISRAVGAFYLPVEISPAKAALSELSKAADKFLHKANGIFNGDFFQQLDGKAHQDSRFYNFYVKNDGSPYGSYNGRGALEPESFEKVLKFTKIKIIGIVKEILNGKITVEPYKLGTASPCSYCEFKSFCRFDWQINDYNFLQTINKERVIEVIGTQNA